jgi:hypothetical protein
MSPGFNVDVGLVRCLNTNRGALPQPWPRFSDQAVGTPGKEVLFERIPCDAASLLNATIDQQRVFTGQNVHRVLADRQDLLVHSPQYDADRRTGCHSKIAVDTSDLIAIATLTLVCLSRHAALNTARDCEHCCDRWHISRNQRASSLHLTPQLLETLSTERLGSPVSFPASPTPDRDRGCTGEAARSGCCSAVEPVPRSTRRL